jgi:hypothetical protein
MSHASVLIGDTSNLSDKMSRLKLFFNTEWKKNGLQPYSLINLKYKNEIYCTRKPDDETSSLNAGSDDDSNQNKTQTN